MRHPFDGILGGAAEPAGVDGQRTEQAEAPAAVPTRRSFLKGLLGAVLGALGLASVASASQSGNRATTRALNEEGGQPPSGSSPRPSTRRLGEEGGRRPGTSSHVYYEEGRTPPATTQALGEEGGQRPPRPTTTRRGEEGGSRPAPGRATTLALGEEGGGAGQGGDSGRRYTTQAVGEEGGGAR
jgi:hypothetical protein